MKKHRLLTIFLLPTMWLIYFLFELVTGRITTTFSLITNLSLLLVFWAIGYIISILEDRFKEGFNSHILFFIFFLLMFFEQGSKIIIKLFFFDEYFEIIPGFLSFNPIINTQGSWLNARFDLNVSFPLLVLTNILALFLFIEIYRYIKTKGHKSFDIDMCIIFLTTGALCSLIDKLFYGGSLDFIGISNLFIADIKDCYINLGLFFFIISIYKSGYLSDSEDTSFKDDFQSIKRFLVFCKSDIKQITRRTK